MVTERDAQVALEIHTAGSVAGRAFDHVLVITFENQGIQLCSFFGVMHPSQTNHIASTGTLCTVTNDERPTLITG
jgi:hypothetical protein